MKCFYCKKGLKAARKNQKYHYGCYGIVNNLQQKVMRLTNGEYRKKQNKVTKAWIADHKKRFNETKAKWAMERRSDKEFSQIESITDRIRYHLKKAEEYRKKLV